MNWYERFVSGPKIHLLPCWQAYGILVPPASRVGRLLCVQLRLRIVGIFEEGCIGLDRGHPGEPRQLGSNLRLGVDGDAETHGVVVARALGQLCRGPVGPGRLPGAGWRAVAADDLPGRAGDLAGAVGVSFERPAELC